MFVFLHVVFFLVWPPITVLAFRGLLSAIDQVGDISDVKDVPFAPTTKAKSSTRALTAAASPPLRTWF